jgi:hypothetical protein
MHDHLFGQIIVFQRFLVERLECTRLKTKKKKGEKKEKERPLICRRAGCLPGAPGELGEARCCPARGEPCPRQSIAAATQTQGSAST